MSRKEKEKRLRKTWHNMHNRCSCTYPSRKYYFDKGICVCPEWASFSKFKEDMGFPPKDKPTLDRINGDMGYSNDNCRWASMSQQARNVSSNHLVSVGGEKITVVELADRLGVKPNTLLYKIRRGWEVEDILKGKRLIDYPNTVINNFDEMLRLKKEGKTFEQIGTIFSTDGSNISREFSKRGIHLNTSSYVKQKNIEEIKRLLLLGYTKKYIAKKIGISESSIYQYNLKK